MKKLGIILLCLCMLLTGCHNKGNGKDSKSGSSEDITAITNSNTNEVNAASVSSANKTDTLTAKLLTLNKEWSLVKSFDTIGVDYEEPVYQAKVKSYTIKKNLSNIKNIGQFSGFTKAQKAMLVKNGFVVVPGSEARINYTYDDNEYKGVPNFISSDCALHLYHQFYDKSLMSVESGYLYDDLDAMTKQMLDKSVLLLEELKDEKLKTLQEKNVVYFMIARMLFKKSDHLDVKADQKLLDLARQEYQLCQSAAGLKKSPLFQVDFDYSQFKVRGHYTRSKKLGKFFKAMMWFGTAPFAFTDQQGNLLYDNIYQSLLITFTAFSDSEAECDAKHWSDIYQPTTQYVGESDDVNLLDMNSLRLSVYGSSDDPNIFNDEAYLDQLAKAVKNLPEPQIKASLVSLSTPAGKQFRFMGQRYILDSEILQKLIDSVKRPIPTSLDVMGVLGSNTAENLLFKVYQPQKAWPEYTEKYRDLKEKVTALQAGYWKTNLYSGWLWSIQDVLTEYGSGSGMPFFMTSKAWKYKSLNTALGSYTELKHDSVLYGKQPMAEGGGPEAYADQHYVEPDITLYSKLLYLMDDTVSILKEKNMLNQSINSGAESYKSFLELLLQCSIKELKNEALSKEEKKQLLWSGGTMETIINDFSMGASSDGAIEKDITDMLVTDIATCKDTYLTLGTGYFDQIYVVVPEKGKLYLARGSVYSFYEFTNNSRLTDEEWWSWQGINKVKADFGDYMQQDKPTKRVPDQPSWIQYFKTGSNHVMIEPLDVDWNKLSE